MVSEIGLGTIAFGGTCDEKTSFALLDLARDSGINWIDTADVYPSPGPQGCQGGTEEIIGHWLKSGAKRSEIMIASKAGKAILPGFKQRGLSKKHLIAACEASLKRLMTDYLDLYFLHTPDTETPLEETLRTLDDLVGQGKVRHIGVSNFSASRLNEGLRVSNDMNLTRFSCVQSRYNLFYRDLERDLLPLCQRERLGVTVYNPLAAGLLSGKYRFEDARSGARFGNSQGFYREAYWQKPVFEGIDALRSVFGPRQIPLVHVALAWLLRQPDLSSIVLGATSIHQLQESLEGRLQELSRDDIALCDSLAGKMPKQLKSRTTDR